MPFWYHAMSQFVTGNGMANDPSIFSLTDSRYVGCNAPCLYHCTITAKWQFTYRKLVTTKKINKISAVGFNHMRKSIKSVIFLFPHKSYNFLVGQFPRKWPLLLTSYVIISTWSLLVVLTLLWCMASLHSSLIIIGKS